MSQFAIDSLPVSQEDKKRLKILLNDLAWEMADKNIFPLFIINYEQNFTKFLTPIKQVLSDVNWEIFKKNVEKDNPKFFHTMDFFDTRGALWNLLMNDLEIYYPKPDDFVDIVSSRAKVQEWLISSGVEYDKEGLIKITREFSLEAQGIIFSSNKSNKLIYYHQFLRRFFTSNFLIGHLLKRIDQKLITIKLLPDPYRMSEPEYLFDIVEADYWYGEKFDPTKLNQLLHNEMITVYGRDQDKNRLLNFTFPLNKTVFRQLSKSDGLTQLEIEEIIPTQSDRDLDKKYRYHRYAHIIWNIEKKCVVHMDFSIMVYKKSDHLLRQNYDWHSKNRSSKQIKPKEIKVLKLEGSIEFKLALELIYEFYRYNELISEYFDSK